MQQFALLIFVWECIQQFRMCKQSFLPRKEALNATCEPTATDIGVFHSTDCIFLYHSGALSGSAAYAATISKAF